MKVGKTPYEIRLDLLRLAYDILTYRQSIDKLNDEHAKIEALTSDDVVREAEKLNAFVSEDKSRRESQSH